MILLLYVDVFFLTGAAPLIIQCKRELASEFDMKDLGLIHYYLELEVWQKRGEIFLGKKEVCCKYPSEMWDDGLQIHGNSHGDISEKVERL